MHQKQEQQANTRKIERKRGGDEEESSEDRVWVENLVTVLKCATRR